MVRNQVRTVAVEAPPNRIGVQARGAQEAKGKGPFTIILLALLFEFGRPQEIVPGLKMIPFASLLDGYLLISVLQAGKFNLAKKQTKLWLIMFAVMVVHIPLANNNFWAAMITKDMFLTFGLYLGIITFVDSLERFNRVMKIWLGVHGFLAVMGVLSGGRGIGGWLGDENDFCMQMDVAAGFALFLMSSKGAGVSRPVYIGLLCLFVLAAMATMSRGGFIGLSAVGLYWWMRSPNKMMPIFLGMIVVLFMALAAPDAYWERIKSTTDDATSEGGGTGAARLYTWGIGFEMFLHNPIIGVGQGNFPWTFEEYQGDRTWQDKSLAGRAAHSLYFTLLPELGLMGLGIFLGMLMNSFKDLQFVSRVATEYAMKGKRSAMTMESSEDVRKRNRVKSALFQARAIEGAFIGYLVASIFVATLYYPTFWVLVAFSVALRNCVEKEMESEKKESNRPN
ncbi:MAG: O-antigen ligase family protein [Nitrospiraceae bacterium]